jgi:hypothetical protein
LVGLTVADDADPVAAELDAIEARNEQAGSPSVDMRRLLALAGVLLGGHKSEPLYLPADACGHDGDHDSHFESGSGEMLCGDSPAGFTCAWCRENLIDESDADWPCPFYVAAFEALTGEKVTAGESAVVRDACNGVAEGMDAFTDEHPESITEKGTGDGG